MADWQTIETRPPFMEQPIRQFIRIEGSCTHHGETWARVYCGEAHIRKDTMSGYREEDIARLCSDGDMDRHTCTVTHWMPAVFPALPKETNTD